MKLLTRCLIPFLVVSALVGTAAAKCPDNPQDCFDFNEDETVNTESGGAERTFSIPPMKVGFVVDLNNRDILPDWTIQIPHAELDLPKAGALTLNVGVATSRIFASVDWEIAPIVRLGPTFWVGYNVKAEEIAYGLGFAILDF